MDLKTTYALELYDVLFPVKAQVQDVVLLARAHLQLGHVHPRPWLQPRDEVALAPVDAQRAPVQHKVPLL